LYGSQLTARTALHARCAIIDPTATMRVQNYAGSGAKTRQLLKSAPQADTGDLFALFAQQ